MWCLAKDEDGMKRMMERLEGHLDETGLELKREDEDS